MRGRITCFRYNRMNREPDVAYWVAGLVHYCPRPAAGYARIPPLAQCQRNLIAYTFFYYMQYMLSEFP
jgi:hypothetical protein